jgi:hypothetical protein
VLNAQATPPDGLAQRKGVRDKINARYILFVSKQRFRIFAWLHAVAQETS